MSKKFRTGGMALVVAGLATTMVLFMNRPSMAGLEMMVGTHLLKTVNKSIIRLTKKTAKPVRVETEQNEVLERNEEELNYVAETGE